MGTDDDRLMALLLHGWVELLTLFILLFVALVLMGWAHGRGQRPADRGPLVPAGVLISAFGLLLLLRHTSGEPWRTGIMAAALIVAGLLSSQVRPYLLWLPAFLLAALLGLGLHLSAAVFTLVAFLVLLFYKQRER